MFSVMIVDNEPIICKGLCSCIDWKEINCHVSSTASDGLEALKKMAEAPADIIICDIRMPGMDGLSLAQRLRQDYPAAKVIILTGFSEFEYAQMAVRYQVVDFLLKPTSAEKLRSAVLRAISLINRENQANDLESNLQAQKKDSLLYQRQLFLENLIGGKNTSTLYVLEQANRLGMVFSVYFTIACALNITDHISQDISLAYYEDALRLIHGVFSDSMITLYRHDGGGFMAFVSMLREEKLRSQLQEYVAMVDTLTDYSLHIGVSTQGSAPLTVPQKVREAQSALQYAALAGSRAYVFFQDIPSLDDSSKEKLMNTLRQIKVSLQSNNYSKFQNTIKEFERIVRQEHIAFHEVQHFVQIVYNLCMNHMIDFDINNAFSGQITTAEELLNSVRPQDFTKGILLIGRQVFDCLKETMTEPSRIIPSLCEYIRGHYAQNLTLESLAGMVHLSPSYLSRIFKQYNGENISTFVQKVRIEVACEMLRNTNQKTYEIAQTVGIDNPVYFSRLFKKTTGYSPTDYKKACEEGSDNENTDS